MIVRADGDGGLLLITQPDHAALAARIVAAWDPNAFVPAASRQEVLCAVAEHDNGWQEVDAVPRLNAETGAPYDFIDAPVEFKQAIWPRAVERLARTNAHAAALVAQHALTLHAHRRGDVRWGQFFDRIEHQRDGLLESLAARTGPGRVAFERNYDLVLLGDLLSLVFCNQWADARSRGYAAAYRNGSVVVAPDPFNGRTVTLDIVARRIPNRRYETDEELQAAWEKAEIALLEGSALGAGEV